LPPIQRDLTNLYISESYYRLMQTDPIDDATLLDGTGSLVTYLAVSGTLDAFYLKGDGSQLTNIGASSLPSGIVSSSAQTLSHLAGTNIISGSGQRSILGLGTTDSPTFTNLTLTGNLTAQQLIISSSVFVVTQSYSSGSTAFGDTLNDFHQFTGSVYITSSLTTTGTGIFQGTTSTPEYILRVKGFNTGSQLAIGVSGNGDYGIQNSVLNWDGTDYRRQTFTANGFYFNIVSGAFQQQNALRINGDGTTRIHEIWTDNYVNAPGLENTDPNGFAELDWYYGGEFADVIARREGVTIDTGDNDTTFTWKFDNSGSLYLPFTSSNKIYNSDGTVWTASYATTSDFANTLLNDGKYATTGSNTFIGNQLIDGNVVIGGTLTAQTYVVSSSIVNIQTIDVSGSTIFGDTAEDTHQFTGSVLISNGITSSMGFYGNLTGTSSWAQQSVTTSYLDPLFISSSVAYYGFAGSNNITWDSILFKPTNIISGSGQRDILGLAETDSPRFSTIYGTNANLDGNLLVGGTITARTYIISSSVVNQETIKVSGSSVFGNSLDDTHQFTGSLYITGSVNSSQFVGNLTGTSSWATNALTASFALNAAGFESGSFATTASNTFTGNQNFANNTVIGDTTYSTLGGNPINLYYGISKGDIANRFGGIKISNYDWSGGNLASKFEIYTDSEAQDFSTRRVLVDGFGNVSINANTEVTGNLVVTGKLTAQEFHTEIVSSSIIYESGSTKFGDTVDDVHSFTGSLYVTGALVIPTVQTLSPTADVGSIVINNNNLYIYF
jgi:hypothetical protein